MTETPRSAPPREPAVVGLVACLVVVFLMQFAFGADEGSRLARMGASTPKFWSEGHWWTLASSTLLHIGVIHLAFNAYFVWAIGPSIAKLTSPGRMLVVFFVGGIAGSLLSQWVDGDGISAGASGGAWGLMLSQALLVWVPSLHGYQIRPGAKGSIGQLIVLNGVISVLPGINGLAHLGGGVGGALVLWLSQRGGRLWDVAAALLTVAHLGALGTALAVGRPWAPVPLEPLTPHAVLDGALEISTPATPRTSTGRAEVGELYWEGWSLSWGFERAEPGQVAKAIAAELGITPKPLECDGCGLWVFPSAERDVYLCEQVIGPGLVASGVGLIADGRERQEALVAALCSARLP